MNKLTASDIIAFIRELDFNEIYSYINPKTKGKIKIVSIDGTEGPIRIKRWNPSKAELEINAKQESISTELIQKIANAFSPNKPINFDKVLGGSYNTRSVLEALLALTQQFYFGYPERIDDKAGHKHLIWMPDKPHELGKSFEYKIKNSIQKATSKQKGRLTQTAKTSKIRIKKFGPINSGYLEDDGFMNINKVTVFIGNQGSGKSTIAKLISTLFWLEKALNRGDKNVNDLSYSALKEIFKYQRIDNYFKNDTEIEFFGEKVHVTIFNQSIEVELYDNASFNVPKIMYVPAERNFLSVIKNAFGIKNLPDTLYTFAEELKKGQLELSDKLLKLPIGNLKFRYKENNDTSYLVGEDFELNLLESSSGYQSLVPLYLVTKFLNDELQKENHQLRELLSVEQEVRRNKEIADVMLNDSLTELEKSNRVKEIDSKYLNTCFINIVEEPEQNLFPSSQRQILNSLLEFNNMEEANKLIMTTHSPYLINYLTLSVEANNLKDKLTVENLKSELQAIVPFESTIKPGDLIIYELDEENGTIKSLENYKGLPSDENQLNDKLGEGNELFARLLEIEQKL